VKNIVIVFCLLVLWGLPSFVRAQAGFTSANFLKIGMGARASAMADSFIAVSDDATAIYWNPAGLYQAQGTQISLTHNVWLQGVNIDFIALSQNLGEAGAIGLGFTTLNLQSFTSTTEDSTGSFAGYGPQVSAGDWALTGGYSNLLSRFIPDRFFQNTLVGISVNIVGQNEAGPTGSALSFNGGLIQMLPDQNISLALEMDNLGTVIQDRSQPLNFKFGAAWYHYHNFNDADKFTLAGDLDLESDTGIQPSLGSEYRIPLDRSDVGFLRAGLRTTDDEFGLSFITLGAGLEHDFSGFVADLDYAYVPYGTLGPTHRITLSIKLGEEKHIKAELSGPDRFNLDKPSVKLTLKCHADDPVANWALLIKDSNGQVIHKVTGAGEPPSDYVWDGLDDKGVLVAPGTYNATLEAKDTAGRKSATDPIYFKAIAPLSLETVQWALSSDVVFPSAQAELLPACKTYLTGMTANLKKYFTDFNVEVQGHTDNSPCRIGPHCKFPNNQVLSEARAQAVKNLLVELGLDPDTVITQGYAATVPVADNSTPEGKSKNRRIEIKIKSYKKATALTVTNAGIFLMLDGQPELGLQLFKDVIEHDPDQVEPYRLLVNCYQIMKNQAEADKANLVASKYGGAMPEPLAPLTALTTAPVRAKTEELTAAPTMLTTPVPTAMPTVVPTATPTSDGEKTLVNASVTPSPTAQVQTTPTATATAVTNFIGHAWTNNN
jgi:outer membrane protein OmpA-like peptidoglycan-associated protein